MLPLAPWEQETVRTEPWMGRLCWGPKRGGSSHRAPVKVQRSTSMSTGPQTRVTLEPVAGRRAPRVLMQGRWGGGSAG